MKNSILQNIYKTHPEVNKIISYLKEKNNIYLKGLQGSAKSLIFCYLFKEIKKQHFLCILNNLEDATNFYYDCCQILGELEILFFPSQFKQNINYGQKDTANEILRTETLIRLSNDKQSCIIVTYPDALAEKVINSNKLKNKTLTINIHEKIDSLFIDNILKSYHFERVDYVYEPGQYAVRGSLIDVFSFANKYPYRIDFFGPEVESIRTFDIETQLSKEILNSISIVSTLDIDTDTTLFSYIPIATNLVLENEKWFYSKFHATQHKIHAFIEINEKKNTPTKPIKMILNPYKKIHLNGTPNNNNKKSVILKFFTELQPSYQKNLNLISSHLKEKLQEDYSIYILSNNKKQIERIKAIFKDKGDIIPFIPVLHSIHSGFIDKTLRVCLFTDHQLFDRFHKCNIKLGELRTGKIALSLKELKQFQLGDYLIHMEHGIGKFGGLIQIKINGKIQEVIKMIFLNEDIIFVSIHNLHKISKYKCKNNKPPHLNKLGSKLWKHLKEKTKKKIKDLAKDLIQLYSKRKKEKGFAFSSDSYLQEKLEASFPYEDTPDQTKVTMEIKKDMESHTPMDRLVCGDVGFGKTEIAIRAATKAVIDGKQVAVLVPTTLLAFQHYNTFKERLADFPITIDYISRAKTIKKSKIIIKKLQEGTIDILIGTHRMIYKDVQFKDLGLLIIDEEQKFGVAVKEKLKQMKINIDSLTLTATPIPRTLQFSLMGARDLSNICTPPPNRYPIHTELHPFGNDIIREAINYEMNRNGQIFIINNCISNLINLKNLIKKEVPNAQIAIAHGQMKSTNLEKIIVDFINYEYDILISTTIIENGINIPNANTIIINNAQNFGLSDLYQLRGRVGRSNRKAFCYLLSPPFYNLTSDAIKRLQAIENFSDLGSGIHIAMQDLDIRGAGNILGTEQSGFINDLGYETYQKILSEAIQELKNEEFTNLYKDENQIDTGENYIMETNIESDLEVYFPASYIPKDSERITLYRELEILKEENIKQFRIKLQDRFGKIPTEGEELIRIVHLRKTAKKLGIEKIILKKSKMILYLVKNINSPYYQSRAFDLILEFVKKNYKYCDIIEKNNQRMLNIQNITTVEKAIKILEKINK